MKKNSILFTYLGAAGVLATSSAIIVGGIKLYANSNELGVYNIEVRPENHTQISNNEISFADFRNAQGEKIASFDLSQTDKPIVLDSSIKSEKRRFSVAEFEDWFADNYDRQTPIFDLKIGVMKFVNEYWDALSPQEFIKYARWFNKNVAWGPEAITLEHFALKKGVTKSGNNLLLGQHHIERKEETKIEFFPDSFFGSFPIYTELSGVGNGADNLTYKIFQEPISKESLDKYFSTIPIQQVLANYDKSKVIGGIPAVDLIKNEQIYIYDLVKILKDSVAQIPELTAQVKNFRDGEFFFVFADPAQSLEKVKQKFELATLMFAHEKNIQLPANFSFKFNENFKKTHKILAVKNLVSPQLNNDKNIPQGVLSLQLENWPDSAENKQSDLRFYLTPQIQSDTTTILAAEIATKIHEKAAKIAQEGFFDLYNINFLTGKIVGIYQKDAENRHFFSVDQSDPSIEAQNEFLSEFNPKLWSTFKIVKATKLSNSKLEIQLENSQKQTKKIVFDLDQKSTNFKKNLNEFNTFKLAVNWKNRAIPKVIQEIETLKDGKKVTLYQLYGEVFDGLIDTVLTHKKTNGENLFGTYVDFEIDSETGQKKYLTKRGNYIGFSHSSRIPYIALLKASTHFFKTTGINYLKYVGTHEYGHHQTLNYAQDNSDPNSNVVLNALSTNSSISLQSFYNLDVLQLYFDARSSGLTIRKSAPGLSPQNNGVYPNFSFDSGGKFENESEIYGSNENQGIDRLLSQPSRRFLQTIDGLKTAAELRRLKLYDLFLLNSIDADSATINPAISDAAQFFRNKSSKSPVSGFINSSKIPELFANSLTDGMGNLLKFDQNGQIIIADFKPSADNKTFSDLKVKVFYANGNPVIDVSTFKNPNSLIELTEKIKKIRQDFSANIVQKFQNNGWNSTGVKFQRFSPSNQYFTKTLGAILTNKVENQAFFGSIFNSINDEITVGIVTDSSIFDLSIFLKSVSESNIQGISELKSFAKNLLDKGKNNFTLSLSSLNSLTSISKEIFESDSNINSSAFAEKLSNFLKNSQKSGINLFEKLKNITNFGDSLFIKIAKVIEIFKKSYSQSFREWIQKNKGSENQAESEKFTNALIFFFENIYVEWILKNHKKIFSFTDKNGQNVDSDYIFATLSNFYDLPTRSEDIQTLTNGPIFASSYFGKLISAGENQYYQNPKYDFYAGINTSQKLENVLDQTEFDSKKPITNRWISPLGNLLKFDKVVADSTKNTSQLQPFFGIAHEFRFKNKSDSTEFDTSKIYLDSWDKTVFKFDYSENYFAFQNQNQETEFNNIEDFIEFISIDPFAMKIAKTEKGYVRNWDLSYVNSKFHLLKYAFSKLGEKFEKKSLETPNFEWKKDQKNDQIIANLLPYFKISETELHQKVQELANFLLEAFEKSTLNLLIKNTKINQKNIDHLFDSKIGFMGFKNFSRANNPNLPSTKFGPLTKFDRIKIAWLDFGSFNETNSLVFDNESFINDDLNNSEKSEVFGWIKDFLIRNNINFTDIDLFKLQYLVGTKTTVDYTTPTRSVTSQFQKMNTDLELSLLRSKNISRFETKPDDFFSNYVYNFPESLTRDYVQIHYSPSTETLDNIAPEFKNITESNTGNEYFVDRIYTRKWIKNFIPIYDFAQGYSQNFISSYNNYFLTNFVTSKDKTNLDFLYQNLLETYKNSQNKGLYGKSASLKNLVQQQITKIQAEPQPDKFIDQMLKKIEQSAKIQELIANFNREKNDLFSEISINLNKILNKYKGELGNYQQFYQTNIQPVVGRSQSWRNGYINKNISTNNGFFKDRFQRKVLDWQLYDDNLEPVKDQNLRITDLKGQKITTRPEAFWYYLLKTQGVGVKTVSGIWRDAEHDKVTFWGFVKNEDAKKAHFLTLEDTQTQQKYFIKIATENTNNIFYLKKQADLSTKWTLADEGYSSWISSWSIIGEFKNALVRPGSSGSKKLRIYFSDEKKQEIKGLLTLGKNKFLAENGKNYQLAPTYITNENGENFLVVRPQFK
ncbi:PDxFFG protein [Mycoplasma sp. 'Moose RK']|uniref:PDxFFG protein n=1 Tax=Mycoplasma sp. 'Moose RK' TaxID=2780095 RepID=UPI0018C3200C|nr:PDxFFG protein [Mycoplasma sp. 'Moose RK']MBG0730671.1 PDxFFG protein [Mycoplasma sp. 'Moose RK']